MTFNLSDKFTDSRDDSGYGYIAIEDVKEFIRLLKESLIWLTKQSDYEQAIMFIDKLAGDKLK